MTRPRIIAIPTPPKKHPQTWGELLALKDADGNYVYSAEWIVEDMRQYVARAQAELERRRNE